MTALIVTVAVLAHLVVLGFVASSEYRNPTSTLAWILTVAFLPGLGLVVYFVFGVTRARRRVAKIGEGATRVAAELAEHGVADKLASHAEGSFDDRTRGMIQLGDGLHPSSTSCHNRAEILVDASATYMSILDAIAMAESNIHVQFYIIQPDRVGTTLRDTLARRARKGISVRVLFDAVGSASLPDDFWDDVTDAGGEVAAFGPVLLSLISRFRRPDRFDFRNHRKIVVVDGRVGFTGGINVGKEYLGLDPSIGHWRDMHVRVHGPAALSLQQTFAEDWFVAAGKTLDDPACYPDVDQYIQPGDNCLVQIVPSGPDRKWSPIAMVYRQAIAYSRERVWITTPYFVPDRSLLTSLVAAALRGVDVRVLVPKRGDSRLVDLASRTYYPELQAAGVRFFQYERGFVHSKTMVVDDWVATIGSANMDMRSFHLNFELNAFLFEPAFVRQLAEVFEADMANAQEAPTGESISIAQRLLRSGARLLSPLL